MKCCEYLLKCKDIVAVLPTGFGKSLLFQLIPDLLPVKADNNILSNGLTGLHDFYGFVTFIHLPFSLRSLDLLIRITRVSEGKFMLCSKKEF